MQDGPPTDTMRLSLMCDDVAATVADLAAKGVEFTPRSPTRATGSSTTLRVPGGVTLDLYQPRHTTAYDLGTDRALAAWPRRAARCSPAR